MYRNLHWTGFQWFKIQTLKGHLFHLGCCLQLSHWSLKSSPLKILLLVLIEEEIPKVGGCINCQTTPLTGRCNQVHLSQPRQLPALYKIPEMSCQEIRIYKLTRNLFPQQKSISKWDLGKIEFHVDFVPLLKEWALQTIPIQIVFSHSFSFLFSFVFNQNRIKTDLSRWILIPICSGCPIMVLSDYFPATTIFIPTPNMRGWERASQSHYPLIPLLSSSVLSSL